MIISIIVAVDEQGGIGKNNRLPWHLPSDLKRFKAITIGHHLVMGRKTYETIGRPLPGRQMIIVTRQKNYTQFGATVVHSLREALDFAEENHESEVFVIGGGEIFRQAISLADKIYLTTVHADVDAEVKFPKLDLSKWTVIHAEDPYQTDQEEYFSDFKVLLRNDYEKGLTNQQNII